LQEDEELRARVKQPDNPFFLALAGDRKKKEAFSVRRTPVCKHLVNYASYMHLILYRSLCVHESKTAYPNIEDTPSLVNAFQRERLDMVRASEALFKQKSIKSTAFIRSRYVGDEYSRAMFEARTALNCV
jgi:hypothetical protein